MLLAADRLTDGDLTVDGFWWALLVALVASAVTLVIEVVAGIDDDGEFSYGSSSGSRARPASRPAPTRPGSCSSRSTGLALPVLRRAMGRQRAAHGPLGGGGAIS